MIEFFFTTMGYKIAMMMTMTMMMMMMMMVMVMVMVMIIICYLPPFYIFLQEPEKSVEVR